MLANSPEIAQSWKKAFDGDPENGVSKMTYQDYMNILQVLNVAAGATNITRNAYKSAKASTKQSNKLAIEVIDTKAKTNKRKALILEGDDVEAFKERNANGEAQDFINELEGYDRYQIAEVTTSNKGKFWGKGKDDKFHLFNQNPFGSTSTGQANVLEYKYDARKKKYYVDTGLTGGDDITGKNIIKTKGAKKVSDIVSEKQTSVEADFAKWR
jgi:hypothetical protein